jgi:hypothetical protein
MPLIAAGISAAGSVLGGIAGGKGAKGAAKVQAQSAREQIAANVAERDYQYNLNEPSIKMGATADNTIAGLLNIGGDPAASEAALGKWRDSTGYKDLIREGLGAVNSNAFARGMGDSGATLKALQDRGMQVANQTGQQYLGNLTDVANRGAQGRGLVAKIGLGTTDANNRASGAAADAAALSKLTQAGNWASVFQDLGKIGANAFSSSYGSSGNAYGIRGSDGIY